MSKTVVTTLSIFIAPIVGALGNFVIGSDTYANVLFGGLQIEVANLLNMSQYWLAAAIVTL